MAQRPRVVYAGTPAFAVPPLRRLLAMDLDLVGVYTQPDRPAGRGRRLQPSPVKRCAQAAGVPVMQPRRLRDAGALAELAALEPDLLVVAAYGLILPPAVLSLPPRGCLNIHASLLPRWRGAAPIQRAILAGDEETGVSLMLMTEGLDEGPVVGECRCAIGSGDTAGDLHDRLAALGAELLADTLPAWLAGEIEPRPQDGCRAVYAPKLEKAEAVMDWSRAAVELARQVRAFDPWPVAETRIDGTRVRVWRAEPLEGPAGPPGTVLKADRDGIDVATGRGILRLTELQPEGRRRQSAGDFLNGHPLVPGRRLG